MLGGLCAITVFLTKVSLGNLLLPGYFLIFAQRVIFQRPGRQSYLFKSKVTVLSEGHILDGWLFWKEPAGCVLCRGALWHVVPISSAASSQEATGGWLWRIVQVDARVSRKKPELTSSFIFKCHRDINCRVKGSAIAHALFKCLRIHALSLCCTFT